MIELEKEILGQIKSATSDAIKKELSGYGSPLNKMINACFTKHGEVIESWLTSAVDQVIMDDSFRESMIVGMRKKIAREITNTFGEGIFKANIQKLKADPTLKARCVLAVERILSEPEK